jgi:hypothetical protein
MKILKTKKYSILRGILKYSFVVVFAVMLFAPIVFADPTTGGGGPTTGGGTNITTKINNPLGNNITDIPSFIKQVINIVLVVT